MQPPGPDHQMVVVYAYRPLYQLPPHGTLLRAVVTVAIVVDEEGRVTSAKAIQGPDLLWANAEESALKWRFEPLAKHGLRAPQRINIDFHYKRIDIKD